MSAMSGDTTMPTHRAATPDLVAQRFSAAGGHEHQCIATSNHLLDNGLLLTTELA